MKDLKVEQIKDLYGTIYWKIDSDFEETNRDEDEIHKLDGELFDLIEEFELAGCDGTIDDDSERKLVDLSLEELELLYNKLVEFQNKL
jgi:hypothetical protein